MTPIEKLKSALEPGRIYRRSELEHFSNAVDRHLQELTQDGTLEKVYPGLYYYPKKSIFGNTPPAENDLVRSFLKDDRFLVTSPNEYNKLGVGTTQLYNKVVVYNTKRHGDFQLADRVYSFRKKPHFPKEISPEFLFVDLLNNLDELAEDQTVILQRAKVKARSFDHQKLSKAVRDYGSENGKRLYASLEVEV